MTAEPHTSSAIHHHGEPVYLLIQALLTHPSPRSLGSNETVSAAFPACCWCLKCQFATPIPQVVYACSGHGSVVFGPEGSKRVDLSPGDFALIPSWTLHQEVNEGDEPVKWIITRTGRTPIVENVESWKDTVKVAAEAGAEDHMQGIPA